MAVHSAIKPDNGSLANALRPLVRSAPEPAVGQTGSSYMYARFGLNCGPVLGGARP